MMKKYFLLFLTAFLWMPFDGLSAKSLVLTLADGTLVYYFLGGNVSPKMKFVDGGVVVNADAYEFSGIKNFYISATDDPNGIETVAGTAGTSFDGTVLRVARVDAQVAVYTVDGKKVDAEVGREGGVTTVDTSGLGKGIYVVRIGNSGLKLQKK